MTADFTEFKPFRAGTGVDVAGTEPGGCARVTEPARGAPAAHTPATTAGDGATPDT